MKSKLNKAITLYGTRAKLGTSNTVSFDGNIVLKCKLEEF